MKLVRVSKLHPMLNKNTSDSNFIIYVLFEMNFNFNFNVPPKIFGNLNFLNM